MKRELRSDRPGIDMFEIGCRVRALRRELEKKGRGNDSDERIVDGCRWDASRGIAKREKDKD